MIDLTGTEEIPTLFYFLDKEKVFDQVEWNFMKEPIKCMELAPSFQRWMDVIYKDQWATIMLESYSSEKINIQGRVRQGCP